MFYTEQMWYLGDIDLAETATFKQILQDAFSYFILFSYIIPISLYVTLGKMTVSILKWTIIIVLNL